MRLVKKKEIQKCQYVPFINNNNNNKMQSIEILEGGNLRLTPTKDRFSNRSES